MGVSTTVKQLIESFPNRTFAKQHGKPNYDKMQTIHKLAAADADSIETIRGGVQNGCLTIVLNDI